MYEWVQVDLSQTIGADSVPAVCNGKVYFLGGNNSKTVICYDPETGSMEKKADCLSGRNCAMAAVYDEKIYLFGGTNASSVLSSMEMYDPELNKWTQMGSMSAANSHGVTAVVGDKLYMAGGNTGRYASTTAVMRIYDFTTGQWTTGASLPTALGNESTMAFYENALYVFGGLTYSPRTTLRSVYRYDLAAGQWEVFEDMPQDAGVVTFTQAKNYVVTVGYKEDACYLYSFKTGEWTRLGDIHAASHNAFFLNGRVYYHGSGILEYLDLSDLLEDGDGDSGNGNNGGNGNGGNGNNCGKCGCCCPCVHIHGNGISVNNLHVHCNGEDTCVDLNNMEKRSWKYE